MDNISDNEFGLVGQSLSFSYSSYIHSLIGNYGYRHYEIAPNDIFSFMRTGSFKAMNIAAPYKKIAYDLSTALSGSAIKSHHVNLVTKDSDGTLKGYNTDIDGFRALLKKHKINVKGEKVLILGTGAAANTARIVMGELGADKIVLVSRHGQNNYDNISVHYDSNVLINATPIGMYPNTGVSPVDLQGFTSLRLVIDFVYNPVRTALLQQAMERGIIALSGLYCLAAQSYTSAQIFLNNDLDDTIVDTIRKKLLTDKRNITLIGMPGSGKAAIGRALSQTLHRPFFDLDAEIEKNQFMSVSDIFQTRGEAYYREAERNVTLHCCKESGCIISTGGGAVLSKENRIAIRENSFVVYIERNYSELYTDGRPVSASIENLQSMAEVRAPIYELTADTTIRAHSAVDANVNLIIEALNNENPRY